MVPYKDDVTPQKFARIEKDALRPACNSTHGSQDSIQTLRYNDRIPLLSFILGGEFFVPAKKPDLSFEVSFDGPAAGKVHLRSMHVDLFKNAQTTLPEDYVQKIRHEIQFLWQHCPFASELEFADSVLNYIFSESRVPHLQTHPFSKALVQTPNRTYTVNRFRFNIEVEKTKFGNVDSIFTTSEFGIYRLRIASGFRIPQHLHHIMEEKEIILTDGLSLDGKDVPAGTVKIWPLKTPHSYENNTSEEQSILCIDKPPFDANDEVLV